jgi:hypothetical protein
LKAVTLLLMVVAQPLSSMTAAVARMARCFMMVPLSKTDFPDQCMTQVWSLHDYYRMLPHRGKLQGLTLG